MNAFPVIFLITTWLAGAQSEDACGGASEDDSLLLLQQNAGRAVDTELKWANLTEQLFNIAADNKRNSISPPLIMVSEACSGSSTAIKYAKNLMADHGIKVFHSRSELFKRDKNPYAKASDNDGEALVAAAKAASDAKEMLIFKIQIAWLENNADAKTALTALSPKWVTMLRSNILDQVTCKVRDCFDDSTGQSVDAQGKKSSLCFKRRKTDSKGNLVNKEPILAKLDTSKLNQALQDKLDDRVNIPAKLASEGFDSQTFYYERLMGFEMDASEIGVSAKAWRHFFMEIGYDFSQTEIESYLAKTAGSYSSPGPSSATIFNADEVATAMKKSAGLADFFRPEGGYVSSKKRASVDETDEDDEDDEGSASLARVKADHDDDDDDDVDDGGHAVFIPRAQRTAKEQKAWKKKIWKNKKVSEHRN